MYIHVCVASYTPSHVAFVCIIVVLPAKITMQLLTQVAINLRNPHGKRSNCAGKGNFVELREWELFLLFQ